jgi:hypothetical protein
MSGSAKLKTYLLPAAFSLTIVSTTFAGRVIYVDDDGPADFNNIQAAIDDSNDGDTIIVADGIYTGDGNRDMDFGGKAITVRSTDPNDREVVVGTVIDCEGLKGAHRGFYFHNGEGPDSVLDGLTIANGYKVSWPDEYGGGIRCSSASPTVKNCIIRDNMAMTGGGLHGCGGPIINCIITGNMSQGGGGISGCSGTISNCIINNNSTPYYGGGLYGCSGLISKCVIVSNTSRRSGGGLYNCGARIENCIISNNSAAYGGGGLHWFDSSATLVNCTITHNSGYGIQVDGSVTGGSECTVVNCILWGNSAGQIAHNSWGSVSLSYSQVGDGWPHFAFVDDYHLMAGSPCIDVGTNDPPEGLPVTDIDGNPRPLDGNGDDTPTADMGAYEYNNQGPSIALSPGPIIDLFLYEDAAGALEQPLSIRNCGGGVLRWQINDTCSWLQADPVNGESAGQINEVVLRINASGLSYGRYTCVVTVSDTESANDPQVILVNLYINTTLRVPQEYTTIQDAIDLAMHGDTVLVDEGTYESINFRGRNITVTSTYPHNTDVVAATVIHGGGSVVTFYGSENPSCVLRGFIITNGGRGIYGQCCTATIKNCVITDNDGSYDEGGGLYEFDGEICHCVISSNSAVEGGGGLSRCNGPITNCIITNNSVAEGGGGLCLCRGTIINCTIADNKAWYYSGGLVACSGTISNCIIWGNEGGSPQLDHCSTPNYSCIQDWDDDGAGNIDTAPYFADPYNGDYHLLPSSPCIDAGDPDYVPEPNETDLDGKPRVINGRIDMGAYEYSPTIPADIRIIPRTINLRSKSQWIAAFIRLPEEYNVADIEPNSILLEGYIKSERFWLTEEEQIAIARFDREEVRNILSVGEIELIITCQLTDGKIFEGRDTVKVIDKGSRKSAL